MADHDAHVAARARLRKIDDWAATWLGTTRETRAMRALYEPLYRDELARRRAVIAHRLRKFGRTLRHHGIALAELPRLECVS